jgi:Zinc carboxypeptidase
MTAEGNPPPASPRRRRSQAPECPDPRYWRYDGILEKLTGWKAAHPELLQLEKIGRTHLGEEIRAVRVLTPGDGTARPTLLFWAALHANEANGTNAIMAMIERLLAGYGRDHEMTAFVDGLETWFIPIVNVDGHRHVFSGEPGARHYRKNCRKGHGVDLNRNWDHNWEADPATDPATPKYKGPAPFSEPEVVALRDLVLRIDPLIVVDLHSPGKVTPPNMIFWPWLFREEEIEGPDARAYRKIAKDFAARTETEEDGVFYDGDWYGYDTLPKAQNWIYRETGACILLMEIAKRCWWEGPIVDTIARRVAEGGFTLLARALKGPGLLVRATDAEVVIEEHHDPRIGPRRTSPRTGEHRRLLEPGPVTVTVSPRVGTPVTRRVEIAAEGWTILDTEADTFLQ